ncbi:MAG: transposase [Methylocella sp.]
MIPTAMRLSSLGEAEHAVRRIGIEASGGYERIIVAKLRMEGFEVIVFQPKQVRAYAMFRLQMAKNDIIDAVLIAACTAAAETFHAPPDPRFATLAEHLTFIEQIEEDIARGKTKPAKDIKLPNSRPGLKRKSRVSKSAAPSNSNASSPSCAPPRRKGMSDATPMPISPIGSIS